MELAHLAVTLGTVKMAWVPHRWLYQQ